MDEISTEPLQTYRKAKHRALSKIYTDILMPITPHILSYFVTMLNTDLDSSKLNGRPRVRPSEFGKNNRGINDSAHLWD